MYSADVIREIQRRLAEPGATQRSVARDMGLSRGTVHNVASGKHKAVDREPPGAELEIWVGRLRCGGCGALIVVAPCRTCKALATPGKLSPDRAEDPGPVKIELVDGDRERYLKVRGDLRARLRRQAAAEQAVRIDEEAEADLREP